MPHNHLIFSFAAMGMTQVFWHDPALPFVECRRAQHSRACYRPHSHPTLSIGAVDAGHTTLSIECAQPVRLTAGDVVLIPPHRVHSCNPDRDGEWSYQMLYLEEQWVLDLLSESPSSVPRITLDPLSWQDKAGGYGALSQLSADLFAPLECEHKESLLIDFVGQLLVMRAPEPAEARPEWLPEIQQRLDQQCEAVWPIGQLAAAVGLSRFHFIRAFHANTGMLGLEQLAVADRMVVARARRLERFLTQPFFTTEQFTGHPGKLVSLSEALDGCERILRDEFKDYPESALYMIGPISEAHMPESDKQQEDSTSTPKAEHASEHHDA